MKKIYERTVAVGQPRKRIAIKARIIVCKHPYKTYAKHLKQYEQSTRESKGEEFWEELHLNYDNLPEIKSGDIILYNRIDADTNCIIAHRFGHIDDRYKGTDGKVYEYDTFFHKVEFLEELPEDCEIEEDFNPEKMISGYATNDLRYSTQKIHSDGKEKIVVSIRLNDECKNGHQDFAMTGTLYERYDQDRWKDYAGGCCHDEILKQYPEFKIFADLHLCDYKGAPLYAVANGFYCIKEYKKGKKEANTPKEYLRVTDEELQLLCQCEDQDIFCYRLYEMGIVARWEAEAKGAIKYLEQLTEKKFLPDSKKSQIKPLSKDKIKLIEDRISSGYYEPEQIRKREIAAIEAKRRKRLEDLNDRALKEIRKIKANLSVHQHVVELGFPDDNLIYYDHKNTAVFNWSNGHYDSIITPEQFEDFLEKVDHSKLPDGITFELKQHA